MEARRAARSERTRQRADRWTPGMKDDSHHLLISHTHSSAQPSTMSYHQPYPPPGQPPQQPYGGYYAPPQGHPSPQPGYGPPPPPPPHPPLQHSYTYAGPQHAYPPPPVPYGSRPQAPPAPIPVPSSYHYHLHQQQQYGPPPVPPSIGYIPGQAAPGDFRAQADALRKAMKGFGTDEATLIRILAPLDPLEINALKATYSSHVGRDLYKDVASETSGYLAQGLLAIIEGPLWHEAGLVRDAVDRVGTKEWVLTEVLLGRSNADLDAIKEAYAQRYGGHSLPRDVRDDLSFKTAELFAMVLEGRRREESVPVDPQSVEADARTIHDAPAGGVLGKKKDTTAVCHIFARSSNAELRAIDATFAARFGRPLETHLEKHFSGHMKQALVHMLRSAVDPARRDALLLEESMKGAGTQDARLVERVVRVHWNRAHREHVKRAYAALYGGRSLLERIRGETSGDYRRLMLAMLE
ncbi:hypothetical protein VTN02DRAFT_1558 [Thermoascus thermophilus]